ncbi:MAG: type II toxin-antitoxin system RelE/ParE family toxin [Planctomycetes bacterium]|nr:type II toxin-antitoxin system RelE/ParE family toxin [Planctomycetota bacterium]
MPRTETIIYKELNGKVPLLEWMDDLPEKIKNKWTERFEDLEEYGNDLRRPICDILRDKIHELRVDRGKVHYRVLYTFVGQNIVLLTHGCYKIKKVPEVEIDRAIKHRENFLSNPQAHTYIEE